MMLRDDLKVYRTSGMNETLRFLKTLFGKCKHKENLL